MDIKRVAIEKVLPWDKNPRNIKTEDFARLKKQIEWARDFVPKTKADQVLKYATLKPLIVYSDNGEYITLGGNMRLRALKELGEKEVEVSIVTPKTEADKIKIALIDNDRAGEYDEEMLQELVFANIEEINLEDFKVDLAEPISLKDVIEAISPTLPSKDGQNEPQLDSERFIEIYCSNDDLIEIKDTLTEWNERNGITVNIS